MKNLILAVFLAAAPAEAVAPIDPALAAADRAAGQAEALQVLSGDYWAVQMRLSPLYATFVNYPGFNEKLDDNGPEGRAAEEKEWKTLQARLAQIDLNLLSESDRVTAEVLRWQLDLSLRRFRHKFYQWDVDHMDGPQSWIPSVIALAQPMKTGDDAEALLTRMRALPRYFQNQIANLKEGLKEGRVAAKVPVEKTIRQLEDLAKTAPDRSPFVAAAKKLPDPLRAKYLPLVVAAVKELSEPANSDYLKFLKTEYLPRARPVKIGLSFLPGGSDAYRYQILYHTTLDKTPAELHRLGLKELEGIHREMEAIAAKQGHKGPLKAFLDQLRKNPANFYKTREEILKDAQTLVARSQAKLPEFFGILPKTPLIVKPVEDYKEKNETAARYFQPPDDLSRPGIYYINTFEPPTRPRFAMTSLAAHEGVPGHHFQIALALEQRSLPAFRRNAGFNAFVEGWALYAERLADEMGLYQDDLSRLGMLSDQAWRAARLVIDTGLHAEGWTRERAIDFMRDNTISSQEECETEIDRYTIWPGQALSYKVGQLELQQLRAAQASKLGAKFDIRAFHDSILRNGAVPLTLLRKQLQ